MDILVKNLNEVLDSWKEKYDLSYDISLQFSKDEQENLCFNEKILSFTGSPDLESAQYDAESITFYFSGNRRIYINMAWPEEAAPYVKAILLGYIF